DGLDGRRRHARRGPRDPRDDDAGGGRRDDDRRHPDGDGIRRDRHRDTVHGDGNHHEFGLREPGHHTFHERDRRNHVRRRDGTNGPGHTLNHSLRPDYLRLASTSRDSAAIPVACL
ncbi:hypothetical protein AB0L40_17450, partial [Patulibacter sp. NPDC049589]